MGKDGYPKSIYLKIRLHWLILLVCTDLFFIFLVWLSNPKALKSLSFIIFLYTVLTVVLGYMVDRVKVRRRLAAAEAFLERQGEYEERELLAVTDEMWHGSVKEAFGLLYKERADSSEKQQELLAYQEFIEAWTHEIKTPLSLAELVMENHREEMSAYVYRRMRHVWHTARLHVDRILYYARLHAEHMDYRFEKLLLSECMDEVLSEFSDIAEERDIKVRTELGEAYVVSDRRALDFMLSQIFANAFKYTKNPGGIVEAILWKEREKIHLAIRDNGAGVPAEDVPFLFDKGFTGNHPGRQGATGMGLYFVKKYAKLLAVDVQIEEMSSLEEGFGIELIFPVVEV